jgi:high affinity Mn2+ porin
MIHRLKTSIAGDYGVRKNFARGASAACGAYDWTMDQISYTWGAMVELNQKFWAFRAGYFLVPVVSNTDDFDMHFPDGEYIAELELRYSLASQPGKLRLIAWANRANMGSYADALAEPITTPNYPDITLVRQVRTNYGFNANLEQAITADLGVFARASWSPGLDEIIGWTDCDESVSAGAVLKGTSWGRPNDKIGLAGVIDGLSPEAQAYFAVGGLGILIGDGALNYRPEKILETYYSYSLNTWSALTFDYLRRRPRLQRRPGTGPYFCWPVPRRVLNRLLPNSGVAVATRLAIPGDRAVRRRGAKAAGRLRDLRRSCRKSECHNVC